MKSRIALLLASASLFTWSATSQAQMPDRADSYQKPSIEVNLDALNQLGQAPTPPANPVQTQPLQAQEQRMAPPIAQPMQPAPIAPIANVPTNGGVALHTYQPPLPPSAFANDPQKTYHNAAGLPPLLPPYQSRRTQPEPTRASAPSASESDWIDDTSDFFTGWFDSEEPTPPPAPTAMVSPKAVPVQPVTITAPPPPVITTPAEPAAPAPTPLAMEAPALAATPAMQPLSAPTAPAATNAARYDGFEIAQALADEPQLETSERLTPLAPLAPPTISQPARKAPIPLPKPISDDQEVLLAEINHDADPFATAPSTKAAPLVEPELMPAKQPTPVAVATPEPAATTPVAPPAAPKVAVAEPSKSEDSSWFGQLRGDLDQYFASEEQAQEQSKEQFATAAPQVTSPEVPTAKPVTPEATPVMPKASPEPAPKKITPSSATPTASAQPDVKQLADEVAKTLAPKPHPNMHISMEPEAPKVQVTRALATDLGTPGIPLAQTETMIAPKPVETLKATPEKMAEKLQAKAEAPKATAPQAIKKVVEAAPAVAKPIVKEVAAQAKLATATASAPKLEAPTIKAPKLATPALAETTTPIKKAAANTVAKAAEKVAEEAVPAEVKLAADAPMQKAVEKAAQAEEVLTVASLPKTVSASPSTSSSAVKLGFSGDGTELSASAKKELDGLATTMQSNQESRLAIRAYASAEDEQKVLARRVALARGLAVRAYLIDQGVNALRINVQSLGNSKGASTPDEVIAEIKSTSGS